ncbi:MAG: hypothetical protein NTV86_23035 [Planctomycetota bacterium]|nr:hypothetical protein [Planctomycetota bacterium]
MAVCAPAIVLLLLEAGLRLGGYGYPTGFFVKADASGGWRTNERFAWRFLPRNLRDLPGPVIAEPVRCLLAKKPAGVVRIFVLGSSAAMGVIPGAVVRGRQRCLFGDEFAHGPGNRARLCGV